MTQRDSISASAIEEAWAALSEDGSSAAASSLESKQSTISEGYRLIHALFEPEDLVLFRPIETWTNGIRKQSRVLFKQIRYARFGARDAAGRWVWMPDANHSELQRIMDDAAREKANVFFGVCPRRGGDGKYDQAWQMRTVRCL